jgi:cyanophycinase
LKGYIVLEGGAEFGGEMAQPDLRALALAGGFDARLSIIPAAAAPDNNHLHAGEKGVSWFRHLGATHVAALPLIDRLSANDRDIAESLARSRLIYMLGGFPHHLAQALNDTLSWQAILAAHRDGAVIAGSSAGAMVLCHSYYDPFAKKIEKGLDLLPGTSLLPHYNTYGQEWTTPIIQRHPDILLIGIDEETGMINDGPDGQWQIYGKGAVTLHSPHQSRSLGRGFPFTIT